MDTLSLDTKLKVPDHVPPELVHVFDFRTDLGPCPHARVAELHKGPRVFYSPVSHQDRGASAAGAWVLTKAEDIRTMLQRTDLFSSAEPRSHAMGESWKLIPLEVDPPEHALFRAPLNPLFSPVRVRQLEPRMRQLAGQLIDGIQDKGTCEFIADFGEPYPVGIFLELMGLPNSELPKFRSWADAIVHDRSRRGEAMRAVKAFLQEKVAERRANPGDGDLVTEVIAMKAGDRCFTDEEVIGAVFLLFIGGLDTVVSSLAYHFRYLAETGQDQERLRADPSLIPNAVEELFRAFAVVTTGRFATQDTEFAGVKIKKGDMVTGSTLLSTSDPDEFSNPTVVDIARSPNRHNAFSFGPHRCLGSHLARREIQIAIEEWMKRIPTFRVRPGTEFTTLGGGVIGMKALPLVW
jgi:cytochrome P450